MYYHMMIWFIALLKTWESLFFTLSSISYLLSSNNFFLFLRGLCWVCQSRIIGSLRFVTVVEQMFPGRMASHLPVFMLFDEDLLTLSTLNALLSKFLDHYFPPNFGKFLCHSFRAGLPSMMAANPNLFSKEETMEVGRWSSDAFLRYTRLHGIRAKSISSNLNML